MKAKHVLFSINTRNPGLLPKGGKVWTAEVIWGDRDHCSGGESEQGVLSGGHGPAEVRVSFPFPLKFQSFFPLSTHRPQTKVDSLPTILNPLCAS